MPRSGSRRCWSSMMRMPRLPASTTSLRRQDRQSVRMSAKGVCDHPTHTVFYSLVEDRPRGEPPQAGVGRHEASVLGVGGVQGQRELHGERDAQGVEAVVADEVQVVGQRLAQPAPQPVQAVVLEWFWEGPMPQSVQ